DEAPTLVHREWHVTMTAARVRAALNANPRSQVGNRFDGFRVTARDSGGRIETVVATGELSPTLRGEELRSILNQTLGQPRIPSTRFSGSPAGVRLGFRGTGFGTGRRFVPAGRGGARARGGAAGRHPGALFPGHRLAESQALATRARALAPSIIKK